MNSIDDSSSEEYIRFSEIDDIESHTSGEEMQVFLSEVDNSETEMDSKEVETANQPLSQKEAAIKREKRNAMIRTGILVAFVVITAVVLSVATFGGVGVVIGACLFTLVAFGGAHLLINRIFAPREIPENDPAEKVEDEQINELASNKSRKLDEEEKKMSWTSESEGSIEVIPKDKQEVD